MAKGRRNKAEVSYNMSRIKASGSEIESIMASALCEEELRGYRKNLRTILGKPDFSWKKYKVAVFCDSSFWHGYQWGKKFKESFKVRKKFWINKIEANRRRDRFVNRELKKQDWTVLRFWDRDIIKHSNRCASEIKRFLRKSGKK